MDGESYPRLARAASRSESGSIAWRRERERTGHDSLVPVIQRGSARADNRGMTDLQATPPAELWSLGCRRSGSRPLMESERAWLERHRQGLGLRALLGMFVVPAGLGLTAIAFAVESFPGMPTDAIDLVGGMLVFFTVLLGIPVSLLLVHDALRERRRIGADLKAGEAWEFAPLDAAAPEGARAAAVFAVAPNWGRVVDPGQLAATAVDVIETAPQHALGLYAPLSLRFSAPEPRPPLGQRTLAPEERQELQRAAHGLLLPRLDTVVGLLALALVAATAVAWWHGDNATREFGGFLGILVTSALGVLTILRQVRSMRLSARIRRDLEAGVVVYEPAADRPGTEFLPFSRLNWRHGGAPAPWRDRRDVVQRLRAGL